MTNGPFDYESIMIYDSTLDAKISNPKKQDTWVIYRKDNGQPVWQGGSQDPYKAHISDGDIAVVKRLYPLKPGHGKL